MVLLHTIHATSHGNGSACRSPLRVAPRAGCDFNRGLRRRFGSPAARLSVGEIMKTPISVAQDNHFTPIQFMPVVTVAAEIQSPLASPVKLQAFRVPWAPLKPATREIPPA